MNARRLVGVARAGTVGLCVMLAAAAAAQNQPATIPTAVAKAMSLDFGMMGKPQYVEGRTPADWPAALVPPNAKVLGGGVVGDSVRFRMRTAVFVLADRNNPDEMLRALLTAAGYGTPLPEAIRGEGFVSTAAPFADGKYCKTGTLASFETVDSTQSALVVAVHLIDGEAGKQICAPPPPRPIPGRKPITVPTITPPAGVMSFGGGSGWSGSSGSTGSTLRTTMPADSILTNYTGQLVKGGWTAEGKPAVGGGIAAQRFSFRDGQDKWSAALIIMEAGDVRDVRLQFTKMQ
jgi:hypothetical protein